MSIGASVGDGSVVENCLRSLFYLCRSYDGSRSDVRIFFAVRYKIFNFCLIVLFLYANSMEMDTSQFLKLQNGEIYKTKLVI